MKRNMSSDSDLDDDVFDDNSKGTPTQSNESCQLLNRKKRRGIIEKRRRDRINNSLTELRRLVPTAFEKQGSAKLEKAEILQMTVDHLKMLHAKGFDAFAFDPHKFAMDYHSIGFRECAAEVARYLVTVEGMDIQDPLRLRLMSHLQCYSAQRELAAKQHHASTPWNAFGSSNTSPFASAASTGSMSSMIPPPPTHESHHQPSMTSSSNCSEPSRLGQSLTQLDTHLMNHGHHHHPSHHHHHQHPHHMGQGGQSHLGVSSPRAPTGSMQIQTASSSTSSSGAPGTGPLPGHIMGQPQAQYLNVNTHSFSTLSPPSGYSPTSTTAHGQAGHSVKPYRPWGAELAY